MIDELAREQELFTLQPWNTQLTHAAFSTKETGV